MSDWLGHYTHEFYARQAPGSLRTARRVAHVVVDVVRPRSVVDVGCGLGTWLAAFRELGIADVLGVDGPHIDRSMLQVPETSYLAHDLRQPLALGRRFDLAVSLEVAEHLAPLSGRALINSLTKLSSCVLFSAAVPHQGGEGHVNEQWQDHWAGLFQDLGYEPVDCVRPVIWNDPDVEPWYAQNTLLYVERTLLSTRSDLIAAARPLPALRVVHPDAYVGLATRPPTVGVIARALVPALRASIAERVGWPRAVERRKTSGQSEQRGVGQKAAE